jgi:hypothetical protein
VHQAAVGLGTSDGRVHPAQALHRRGRDADSVAQLGLQPPCHGRGTIESVGVLGMPTAPPLEALVQGYDSLLGALVGIGDDAFLDGSIDDPAAGIAIGQPGYRVRPDRPCQLRVAGLADPGSTGRAVAEIAKWMLTRQRLVDVMEERGCLGQASIDGDAGAGSAAGEERGHLGHDGHVLQQAWRGRGRQEQR